jgi:hypothetical protein
VAGGALIAVEQTGALFTGYHRAYVEPAVHFSYPLVPWLHPWPWPLVYVHFLFNAACALAVAAGWHYRLVASVLCAGLSSLFLMERGVYLNHAYLYCLYAGLLAVVPADRAVSLDVASGRVAPSATAPAWALWLLRFQMAVVYFFSGVAKLEPDWLAALPAKVWLADRAWYPVIGPLLTWPPIAYAIALGGAALDLCIVPALLWHRTRIAALAIAAVFHVSNAVLFGVGTFPWFSLAATALFLAPETFRRLSRLRAALPADDDSAARPAERARLSRAGAAALVLYVAVQLVLPLRPFLYAGRSAWSDEGATFAWRMMLRDKRGSAYFLVRDRAHGTTRRVSPDAYVTEWQLRTLVGTPDMLLQFAHWLARRETLEHERESGAAPRESDIEVRAITSVSFNGRAPRPLVNPRVDLAREPRRLGRYSFVMPPPP